MNFERYLVFGKINQALAAEGLSFGGTTPRRIAEGETPDVTIEGLGYKIEVHFTADATTQQRARVAEIIAGVDKSPRQIKVEARQLDDLTKLKQSDLTRLLNQLLVEKLGADPGFARRAGVNLDGDETVQRSPLKQND